MLTPATAIIVPAIARKLGRSLWIIITSGITHRGVVAINVEAIPICVNWIDISDNQTPIKGLTNAAAMIAIITLLFFKASPTPLWIPVKRARITMESAAAAIRMNVAFNGGMLSLMPTFARVIAVACPSEPHVPRR